MDGYNELQSANVPEKKKRNIFIPIGITGLLIVCGYGAYIFKNRGKMSTSIFLIQLRVAAQGTMIGTLIIGAAYSTVNHMLNKSKQKQLTEK